MANSLPQMQDDLQRFIQKVPTYEPAKIKLAQVLSTQAKSPNSNIRAFLWVMNLNSLPKLTIFCSGLMISDTI